MLNAPKLKTDNLTEAEIKIALSFIDPDLPYEDWLKVAMAIKSKLGEGGFDLFDRWSAGGKKYDESAAKATWNSITPNGKTTIGTLLHIAKQYGYKGKNAEPYSPKFNKENKAEESHELQKGLDKAKAYWSEGKPVTSHPYATAKGVSVSGLRQDAHGWLLVPAYNADGEISTVQRISPKGKKLFLKGCVSGGCYFPIGKPINDTLIICEGWATGMSIHEATGHAVVVALCAGNLKQVARDLRDKYPDFRLIIAADNDDSKTGQVKGQDAALAVNGLLIVPQFDQDQSGTDFNDLHLDKGLDEVKNQIENASAPERTLKELAQLKPIEYDKLRVKAAEKMGVRVSTLDSEVEKLRPTNDETVGSIQEPSIWPEPVVLSDLLDEIVETVNRHIKLELNSARAIALFVILTYCLDSVYCCPILGIESPEKRCGKTTLLDLLDRLCYRTASAANISPAVVYRLIELIRPTLLIDEADTFMKTNPEIIGILNSGVTRASAFVWRCDDVNGTYEPRQYSTWGAKAIAQIGKLPETLRDRAIIVSLRRKLRGEKVHRLRKCDYLDIQSKAYTWALENQSQLAALVPDIPENLNDREADSWEPLLAISQLAGVEWAKTARAAASKLCGVDTDTDGIRIQLLTDLREIFDKCQQKCISTSDLIKKLCAFEDHPWLTYAKGNAINPRQLANLLKPFKITPKAEHSLSNKRGYRIDAFDDVFRRYLPDLSAMPLDSNINSELDENLSDMKAQHVADEKPLKPLVGNDSSGIAHKVGVPVAEHSESDKAVF